MTPDPLEDAPTGDSEAVQRLVQQWQAGTDREGSFRQLFLRFRDPLLGFFRRRGFPPDECRDLVQETFLRVHRGLSSFRGESRWEHWLFQIAANTASKALRHRSAASRATYLRQLADDVAPPPELPVPLRRALDQEARELLRRSIAALPSQMRRCVWLRVYQDLDYRDIAALLQISTPTVKVQLFRARRRLRRELGGYFDDFHF